VRAPIRYRDQEIGAMLANIERMDINDGYVQAEIACTAVNAREWEPVLSPAETKYLKAMEEINEGGSSIWVPVRLPPLR
jgi:hypothetical protein